MIFRGIMLIPSDSTPSVRASALLGILGLFLISPAYAQYGGEARSDIRPDQIIRKKQVYRIRDFDKVVC